MTCTIILTPVNGRFRAHVVELPRCEVEAKGRDKVIALLKKRIEEVVERSEILRLEISAPAKSLSQKTGATKPPNLVRIEAPRVVNDKSPRRTTPWDFYGIFKNDPTWMPMIDEIEKQRDRQKVVPTMKRRKR
jgi:hypothetical protein